MKELDNKINEYFPGLVVRKDLVNTVKGNAIVPSYVLEYLLGQYCATNDEASIETGIETVKEILRKHYVHRNEAELIRSTIREKGRYKVIDKISVVLNEKADVYEASFVNLGISKVLVDSETIKNHPKLLVSGVWCIADLEYEFVEDKYVCPWVLSSLKPIQLSYFDFDSYLEARKNFTTDEWIDLLLQSIGLNPELFDKRGKLIQLIRMIPFCERNYNLIELGPKGTGKSHIYSEFSPHGILLSGGEVTVPKLFVNNSTGKIGLVGYWDVVAFDEFAGKKKRVNKALVDIMKNYMANKSFSRGVETLGAEASMVFVGNTQHTVPYMLKYADLFHELPEKFYDSAFLDRLHFYIPGWEVDIIRGEMFSNGYGFVVDYLAEILRFMRNHDFSNYYKDCFTLSSDISTRDRDSINKTFSGLMKVIFPHGNASQEEIEELLQFAIEGRKRIKDQLLRIDSTYSAVNFSYQDSNGQRQTVKTLEEQNYETYYYQSPAEIDPKEQLESNSSNSIISEPELKEQHLVFPENQTGISFNHLLAPYLRGVNHLNISEPNLHRFYQFQTLMEFLETVLKQKTDEAEIAVHLITIEDQSADSQQKQYLEQLAQSCLSVGIHLTWEFDKTETIQDCYIITDQGWKIIIEPGLNIFQEFDINNPFTFASRLQQFRPCQAFEVTYVPTQDPVS